MPWPLSQDYNEAIQSPHTSFGDPELRGGKPALNAIGLPLPCSGNFADVYRVNCPATQHTWAVKCFTRQIPGLRERYHQISLYLQQLKLPFMVGFTFLDQGIRIRGDWYPILKMEWAEGLPLNLFVKNHLGNPQVLEKLCQIWVRLAGHLRDANLSHCDLQHGNVLLVPGAQTGKLAVRLVDYDGLWVPSLTKLKSLEVGHPSYQHPQRQREGIYNLEVDRFSHLVIYTALRSLLVGGKSLWDRYDNGDNLLFCQADFKAPAASKLLNKLKGSADADVRRLANCLVFAAQQPLNRTALLTDLVPDSLPFLAQPVAKPQQIASIAGSTPPTHKQRAAAIAAIAGGSAAPPRRAAQSDQANPAKPRLSLAALCSLGGVVLLIATVALLGIGFSLNRGAPVDVASTAGSKSDVGKPDPSPEAEHGQLPKKKDAEQQDNAILGDVAESKTPPKDLQKAVAAPEEQQKPAEASPSTDQGTLFVDLDDPNLEVAVKVKGIPVQGKTTKRAFTLSAGQGEIEVWEKDGITMTMLTTRQFELPRGGTTTVKLTPQELTDARKIINQGTLIVVLDDPNLEVAVKVKGVLVQDKTTSREFTLSAGEGEIEVWEKDGNKLATRQFDLPRGGKKTVKVSAQELVAARKPNEFTNPVVKKEPPAVVASAEPDRRAAAWVLSIDGTIKVRENYVQRQILDVAALPPGAFELAWVDLTANPKVSDAGLANFKDCKNVTHLILRQTKVSDAGLAHFQDCKNLLLLDLGRTKVSDAGLAHFKNCHNLANLYLFDAKVSDAGLAHFKDCKNLTTLSLHTTKVSDACLVHFKDCKNLKQLDLGNTKVSDAGMAHFKDCKKLTWLQLSGTQVSDAGLAHFKDCKDLTNLFLGDTKVSDAGMAYFGDCKNLTLLDLRNTKVSAAGVAELQKDLPGCKIISGPTPFVNDQGQGDNRDKKLPAKTIEKTVAEPERKSEPNIAAEYRSVINKALLSKLTETEWLTSRGVSFYWDNTGRLWCDGSLVDFDGLDEMSVRVDGKSKNAATLTFNSDFTRFEQSTGTASKAESNLHVTGKRLDPDDWHRIQIAVEIDGKGKLAIGANVMRWNDVQSKSSQVKLADSAWNVVKTSALDHAALSKIVGKQLEIHDARLLQITRSDGTVKLERDKNLLALVFDRDGQPGPGKFAVLMSFRSKTRSTAAVIQRFVGHAGPVNDLALTPDSHFVVSGGDDKTMRTWELESGKLARKTEHGKKVVAVAVSANGKTVKAGLAGEVRYPIQTAPNGRMFFCTAEKTITAFDPATSKVTSAATIASVLDAWVLAFTLDCSFALVVSDDDSGVRVVDLATGKQALMIPGGSAAVAGAGAVSPDGKRVAFSTGEASNAISLCELGVLQNKTVLQNKKGVGQTVKADAGLRIASRRNMPIQDGASITILRFSPDGHRLVSGHADGSIRIWDVNRMEETYRFQANATRINRAVFLPDGRRLLVAAADGSIVLWALPD